MIAMKRLLAVVFSVLVLAGSGHAQQKPAAGAPAAAQDGFVPVDAPVSPEDAMPAPRLVATAYAFIWVVFFGYLVSLRVRLAKVERELATVSRRAGSGGGAS
jgi:CcmD family protein